VDEFTLPAGRPGGVDDGDARRCVVARLSAARDAGEALSALVEAAAVALSVSPRTVWRWLDEGTPAPVSRAWVPGDDDLDAYLRWKGNAAAAWRERRSANADTPGLRSFQTALARRMSPGDLAALRDGSDGRRRHQVYLRWEPEGRNELWEADHKQLDVAVLFPRARRPRQPWVTTFVDGHCRAVMGWAIAEYPSAATVLAAMGEAIRVDDDRGPFGGVPVAVRPDRGLEFMAEAFANACGLLGVRLAPAPAYMPFRKGKVERFHGTIITSFLAELPHYQGGPRDAAGKLLGGGLPVLGVADLVARFDAWVLAYNRDRPHGGLVGATPLERWQADATPLRVVAGDELRWLLLDEGTRKVAKSGIRFHSIDFVAPELNGLVGETVEVRYRPHDDTSIEVFRHGTHLCTALPQGALGADERAAVLERRRQDAARQASLSRRANRRARERFKPLTAPGEPDDATVITDRHAAEERGLGDPERLRRAARADLLGLPSGRRR